MAFGLKLPLTTLSTILSLLLCSEGGCHCLKLIATKDKFNEKSRSRGWSEARITDALGPSAPFKTFPDGLRFSDDLATSNIPQKRTLPSEQELQLRSVVTSRHLSAPRINHEDQINVAKRKSSRARSYIGRRDGTGAADKSPDVKPNVPDGKDYVATREYYGDASGKVPVGRIHVGLLDGTMSNDEDSGGEPGMQDFVRLTDGQGTASDKRRGLEMEHGGHDRSMRVEDYTKEGQVRKGGTVIGKNSDLSVASKSYVRGVPVSFVANAKLRNAAMKKRRRRMVVGALDSYPWTGIDPQVNVDRKGRGLWFDFENPLPWETEEYQPPEWSGHCRKNNPNELENEKRHELKWRA